MLYTQKAIFQITPLPPHNGHISTMATFSCPQGDRCLEVRLNWSGNISFFLKEKIQQKKHIRHDFVIICSVMFQVLLIALGFKHSPRNTAFYHNVKCAVRKSRGTSTAKLSWRLLWERLTDRRETPWWDHGHWERLACSTGNDLQLFDLV